MTTDIVHISHYEPKPKYYPVLNTRNIFSHSVDVFLLTKKLAIATIRTAYFIKHLSRCKNEYDIAKLTMMLVGEIALSVAIILAISFTCENIVNEFK